jgi:hypothetical protein
MADPRCRARLPTDALGHGDPIEPQQNRVQYWMYCRTEYEESTGEGLYISFCVRKEQKKRAIDLMSLGRLRPPAFAPAI